jgi:hypothetical protein
VVIALALAMIWAGGAGEFPAERYVDVWTPIKIPELGLVVRDVEADWEISHNGRRWTFDCQSSDRIALVVCPRQKRLLFVNNVALTCTDFDGDKKWDADMMGSWGPGGIVVAGDRVIYNKNVFEEFRRYGFEDENEVLSMSESSIDCRDIRSGNLIWSHPTRLHGVPLAPVPGDRFMALLRVPTKGKTANLTRRYEIAVYDAAHCKFLARFPVPTQVGKKMIRVFSLGMAYRGVVPLRGAMSNVFLPKPLGWSSGRLRVELPDGLRRMVFRLGGKTWRVRAS